jgi:uncharacterized protein
MKMKMPYMRGMFVVLMLLGMVFHSFGQKLPEVSNRLVTDYTQTLQPQQLQQLESKLVAFDDTTSTQIAVVILPTTDGYDIADFGVRLAQKWGIGRKGKDNGILLLVALQDRAVTIQTGYGVEGAVPDAIAYRIIQNEIKPAFRQGDYYTGIDRAVQALMSYTKGEYKAEPRQGQGGAGAAGSGILIFILIIVFIVIVFGRGRKGGGGGGNVLSGRGASDLFWWTLLSQMGKGGGGGGFGGGGFGGGGASGRW